MKIFTVYSLPLILVATLLALTGCDRYRVTLNERVISDPPRLLTVVNIEDDALKSCIEQTIMDLQIRTIDGLDTLVCTNGGIQSLEGIQVFNRIRTLNLADNSLTTLDPLLFLGNLHSINLSGNPEIDCQKLGKLQSHLPEDGTLIKPEHCIK